MGRYLRHKRLVVVSALVLTFLVGIAFYIHRVVVVNASLDSRPLEIGLAGSIDTAEPAQVSNHQELLLASLLYEGLLTYDEQSSSLKPNIAKNWSFSTDGKTLVVTLNKDVHFINGRLLTAADVKKSWEKNFTSAQDMPAFSLFLGIQGASERLEGKTSDVSGIQVVNDFTLKIVLTRANASFPAMLTNPVFWVYDCQEGNPPFAGTGPFVVRQNPDNKDIWLDRNEKYHGGRPLVTSLHITVYPDQEAAFQAYKAGKLDYLDAVPLGELAGIEKDEKYSKLLIDRPLWDTYDIGFNLNRAPFKDNYKLRRALNYAVDRQTIIDKVMGGNATPLKAVLPQGIPGFNESLRGYSYDPDRAKALLEEAGYPGGKGLSTVILSYNNDEGHRLVAETVAQQLGQVGFPVQIQPMDWSYYKSQLNAMNLTLFRMEWRPDYPDADAFLYSIFHSSKMGVSNYGGYNNPQVDKMLEASRSEVHNPQERIAMLNRIEEMLVDDAPYIWLFQRKAAKMISPQVHNLKLDGMENVDWAKVELHKLQI
ncbi:MAG TPA: ABC transporter substrate-binding protein [Syntrophomonadaceae bacterium]|nr:ABC transporter substrate-binding protein [Syntrophomonadaceae bacterium]